MAEIASHAPFFQMAAILKIAAILKKIKVHAHLQIYIYHHTKFGKDPMSSFREIVRTNFGWKE